MVEIEITYAGELRTRAVHLPSGKELHTDAPKDNEGLGESFSPTDLLATALATCAVTTLAIVARREEIPLGGMQARIVKHMVADPKRRIGALPLQITITGRQTAAQRERLAAIARTCPVALSLGPEVQTRVDLVYVDPAN